MVLDIHSKTPLQKDLPASMNQAIVQLAESKNQYECLQKAFHIMTERYHGDRLKTFTYVRDLFRKDVAHLWECERFLHCTNSNYLLRHLLVKSGWFTDKDISLKRTLIWYVSPHQYLQVKVGDKKIDVDIRAHSYGVPFGDHSHGFHGSLFKHKGEV